MPAYRAGIDGVKIQYKKEQIDEQGKHWTTPHPCASGQWDVKHYKEDALYVAQPVFLTEGPDGTPIENRRFMRKTTSQEGVIEALETLLVYVDPTTIFRADRRLWRRRGAA